MEKTGRKMDLWRGACYVHVEFTKNSIGAIRDRYPAAPVVAHPECTFAVRMLADEVCSTEKMVNYCRDSDAEAFIIVTESGMLHRLKKEIPGKTLLRDRQTVCLRRMPIHEEKYIREAARLRWQIWRREISDARSVAQTGRTANHRMLELSR